jgi:hypothetical protein
VRLLTELDHLTFVGVLDAGETRELEPVEQWADPIETPTAQLVAPDDDPDGWPARGFRVLSGDAHVLLIADGKVYFAAPFSCRVGDLQWPSYPIHGLYIRPRTTLRLQAHNPSDDRTAVAFQLLRRLEVHV